MPVGGIAITEGSGKTLHSWQRTVSAVNREEQFVQLAEPALPTFTVTAGGGSVATTTNSDHVLQLMAGASMYVRLVRIRMYVNDFPAAAALLELDLFRLTTAGTGGLACVMYPHDTADSATATAQSLPTVKGTEGGWLGRLALGMGTAATSDQRAVVYDFDIGRAKPIIIPAGTSNGLALKVVAGIASSAIGLSVVFTETAWL